MSQPETKAAKIFIGCSSELGREVAQYLQAELSSSVKYAPEVWDQDVFGLSEVLIDSLIKVSKQYDFGVFIITPDNMVRRGRKRVTYIPNSNVLIEIGLFMGSLGRERTFIVHQHDVEVEFPSDLQGVIRTTYRLVDSELKQASVGPAATRIKGAIGNLPLRKQLKAKQYCADFLRRVIEKCPESLQTIDIELFYEYDLLQDKDLRELCLLLKHRQA